MGQSNMSLEDLRAYFKTHGKIREQKAHTSKVTNAKKIIFKKFQDGL